MIPHSSATIYPWCHPSRAVTSGSGRADGSPAVRQFDTRAENLPTPQPQPRPLQVIDLSAVSSEDQEREPPVKRPRLDVPTKPSAGDMSPTLVGPGELKNASGFAYSRPPAASWRTRPVCSFQDLMPETPAIEPGGELEQHGEPFPLPPLPNLPWKYTVPESADAGFSGSRDIPPSNDVQTVPYRIQVPEIAPVLKDNSKSWYNTSRIRLTMVLCRSRRFLSMDWKSSGGCP